MSRTGWTYLAVSVALTILPRASRAQLAPYLRALATPPRTVGMCTPAPRPMRLRATAPVAGLRGRQLVITSPEARARRELAVYADAGGRARQYEESGHVVIGSGSSVGDEVHATLDSAGGVTGFVLHHTLAARAPAHHTRRPLDAVMRAKVRMLSAWMLTRCPA